MMQQRHISRGIASAQCDCSAVQSGLPLRLEQRHCLFRALGWRCLPSRARADDDLESLEQQAISAAVDRVAPSRRRHRDRRRPGAGRRGAPRHRPDHRPGDRSAGLHRLQRVQLRQQAGVDPGAAARRHAQAGEAGGHRPQPHARAAEDRGRPAAARAGNRRRWPKCAWGNGAIAVGRTFRARDRPNMSVGVLSAVGRIWGKAMQTDAAVSPNNYGGPLVDIRGRVLGVLVPLSPQSADEMAGVEWYDSGIGFAIPPSTSATSCPRLKQGHDLYAGLAGFNLKLRDLFTGDADDRRLPPQVARRQGRLQGRRPDRGDRRPQDRPGRRNEGGNRPPLRRRQGAAWSRSAASSGSGPRSSSSPSSTHISTPCWAFCPCGRPARGASTVRDVYPRSPAARAGIAAGDMVLTAGRQGRRRPRRVAARTGRLGGGPGDRDRSAPRRSDAHYQTQARPPSRGAAPSRSAASPCPEQAGRRTGQDGRGADEDP